MGDAPPMRDRESQVGRWAGAIRVFLTCWLVYTVFWTPWIVREHFPAIALAESGHLNVERYLGWTEEILLGPRGEAYINNNPGASLTGAVPLLLLRPILIQVDNWNQRLPRRPYQGQDDPIMAQMAAEGS